MIIVGVFGVSAVGKTTLIEDLIGEEPTWIRVSAGSLIQRYFPDLARDSLRTLATNQILDNQEAIVHGLADQKRHLETDVILFDGHLVIDAGQELFEVPLDIVRRLNLALVFVNDAPHNVERRRVSDRERVRAKRSSEEITQEQSRSRVIAESYAFQMGIPLAVVTPRQRDELLATIKEWYRTAR